MAAAKAVPSTNTSHLDNLLQDVAKNFSEQEMKDAVNWTKNILQGEYTKVPDDDLSKCFDLLRQHGRVSETDTSGIEFYADKFCKEKTAKGSISKEIETFKGKIHVDQQDTAPAAQFIGRDEDVRKILDELQTRPQADSNRENVRAINLHGEGGVGKTRLADEVAKRLCSNSHCKSIVVNLRDIKEMQHVYFEVLRKFGQLAVFGSPERIYRSIENLKHELVLVFDNTEDFFMNFQNFKGFLTSMIEHDKQRRLQILLTSRVMLDGVAQLSNYLVKPFAQEASKEILLQRTGFNLNVSLMSDLAELCSNKPLLLKGIAGILKEKLADGEDVLARIETNLAEGSYKKTKGISWKRTEREVKVKQPATDLNNNDGAVLQEMFSKLSEPLRNSLVKLSLFCRDFPLPAAQQMLGRSTKETLWYINILISKGCVESKRNEGGEKMFDLHPLMQEFLKDATNTPKYQTVYQEAKVLFCNLFREKLKKLVQSVDTDFIQVYSDFEVDRPNFEQLLKLSPEKEFLTLLQDVREFYLLPCLLEPLLTVQEREYLFHSLAETAVKEGNLPFAANLKCWEALQVNQAQGGKRARKVLAKAESFLTRVPEKNSEQYESAKSMYLYTEGKTYYKLSQSEAKQKDDYCRKALESLQQSLELTERIYGRHTATARCLNEMGNCYNRLENLEMASAYYERAYKMRKELSGSNDHYDMAVDLNQIATVHEKTGVKLLQEKKTEAEGKRELNKAIEFYQKALDLEIKLKIDGYNTTALFKRNMANAYLHLEETEKAWKPASEAYEIRQRVLGTHPDTVKSLFQLGNVKYWGNDYPAALEYFKKAHKMEESLPSGHHSTVRQLIKKRIVVTGGTIEDGDPEKPGKLKSLGSSIKKKAGNALQATKKGFLNVLGKQGGPVWESVGPIPDDGTEEECVDIKEEVTADMKEAELCEEIPNLSLNPEEEDEEELKERTVPLRVTPSGCGYPLPSFGLHIYVPPNAVIEPVDIICTVIPEAKCPSLPIRGDTLVSNVIRMKPENMEFSETAVISLMHCHPKGTPGYENVVKFLDPVSKEWREQDIFAELSGPADVKRRFDSLEDAPGIRTPYVQVKLPRCQTLAVFSRLVVDVFHVDPCGDEFTSTVNNLVKVKFLKGAVEKTSVFSMKVVGNAGDACGSGNAHGGPTVFLSLKSDPSQIYSKPVTIQLPLPILDSRSSREEGSLKIFRCETNGEEERELPWSDITDEVAASLHIQEDVVQFDVGHFCWFTCCYTWANEKIGDLHQYLLAPKKSVSFGAFVKTASRKEFPSLILVFTCCASHKQDEVREHQEDQGNETIGEQNSDQEMTVNEKAYFVVSGGIRNVKADKEWFVTFLGEGCDRKSIRIEVVRSDEQNCAEFKTKEEDDLCWMPILKLIEKLPTATENPKHYCGIVLEALSDMPEDVFSSCLVCFESKARRNIETQESWDRPGGQLDTIWNEVTQLSPKSEDEFFHTVIATLQSPLLIGGAGHLVSWLVEGRKMIKEPIDLKREFHMEVFGIVANCSDKVYWKKLARRLGMQHNYVENIEHDYKNEPIDEQCYQMLVSWTQRTGRITRNAASLEKLLSALTGMKCLDVVEIVADRITNEVKTLVRQLDNSTDQPPSETCRTDWQRS